MVMTAFKLSDAFFFELKAGESEFYNSYNVSFDPFGYWMTMKNNILFIVLFIAHRCV